MRPKGRSPTPIRVWTDPSCPWAWETAKWLIALRDRGVVTLTWSLFSLEINATPAGAPFADAAPRHGPSLAALALARREGGQAMFERMYLAFGTLVHEDRRDMSADRLAKAGVEIGVPDIPDALQPDLGDEIIREYAAARQLDVFGVPTLQIKDERVVYGPIVASGPTDDEDALALWDDVRRFSAREDLFELKRWPRHTNPSQPRTRAPREQRK